MKPALLVIDMQRYFLEVGHEEKLVRARGLVDRANELIDLFHGRALPVVIVQVVHQADGSTWNQAMRPHWTGQPLKGTLLEGTEEAQLHPGLHRGSADILVTKTRGSAFLRTGLEETLRALGVDAVVLAGFSTDRCVGLTAIDAWERDFQVLLAGEAILGTTPADGERMLEYLRKGFAIEPLSNAAIREAVGASQVPEKQGPSKASERVVFDALPWQSPMPGVRYKVRREGGRQLRLVEFARGFVEPDWCRRGHVGYVLEGRMSLEFPDGAVELGPGDGLFIPAGDARRHKGTVLTDTFRAVLVEDVP